MTWWSWKRGIKSAGWRAGKVGRSDLVKCIITAVNSDGTYDVRRAGIADDTADIKRVASIAKIDSFAVGDIASLGFAEGDRQKPFLWGFINGGAKHISVVVNPLPVPPEPELGEPAIPYVAPYPEGDPRRFIISCYSEVGCTLFGYRIGFSGPFKWVGLACLRIGVGLVILSQYIYQLLVLRVELCMVFLSFIQKVILI